MFPLRDDNLSSTTPVVTIVLIVLNVVVFLFELVMGLEKTTVQFGLIPAALVHHVDVVARMPGPDGAVLIHNFQPSWLTILTSMFMHGGLLHIASNLWFLWIFGNNVEDAMGPVKYALFYLFSGLCAAGAQVLLGPSSTAPMVGASGAIAGVLGAYLVLFPGSRVVCLLTTFIITTIEVPAVVVLGMWGVLQVVQGLWDVGLAHRQGGVAYAAHVGGFVVGLVLGRILGSSDRRPPPRQGPGSQPGFMRDWE